MLASLGLRPDPCPEPSSLERSMPDFSLRPTKPSSPASAGGGRAVPASTPASPQVPASRGGRDVFVAAKTEGLVSPGGATVTRDFMDVNDPLFRTDDLAPGLQEARQQYVQQTLEKAGFAGDGAVKKAKQYVDSHSEEYSAAVYQLVAQGTLQKVMASAGVIFDDAHLPEQATVYQLMAAGRFSEVEAFTKALEQLESLKARQKFLDRANEQIAANTPAENKALLGLGDRQKDYLQLRSYFTGDPYVRLALQRLLLEGRVPGEKNAAQQDLLTSLTALLSMPLPPALDRRTLIRDLIREVATPTAIDQQGKGTCTVTSLQILMAERHPAEYVRLVAGLASPSGSVVTQGRATLRRDPGTERDDDSLRTLSARLWQSALMEYANGPQQDYSNAEDRHSGTGGSGLGNDDFSAAVAAVLGAEPKQVKDAAQVLPAVEQALKAGKPAFVALRWSDEPGGKHGVHEILVRRIAGGRVYYANPWGREEAMPLAEFRKRVLEATLPQA